MDPNTEQPAEGPARPETTAMAGEQDFAAQMQQMFETMHAANEARAQETERRQESMLRVLQAEIEALKRPRHPQQDGENPETSAGSRENPETSSNRRENPETSPPERDPVASHGRNRNSFALSLGLPTLESAPRPKEPDTFSGNRAKLNSFENQIRSYIRMCPRYFADEERQVRYALSYLRGDAQEWFEPKQRVFDRHPERCTELATLNTFFDTLRLHYGEIDEEQRAAKAIMTLTQTGSAAKYATEFQRLWAKLDSWAEATMVTLFFRGLKPQLRLAMVAQGATETTSLDSLITKAVKLDNQLYDLRLTDQTTSNPNYHGPAPMELGQLEQSSQGQGRQGRGRLSEAARAFRRRNGECFHCGEKGHIVRECPKKANNEASKPEAKN